MIKDIKVPFKTKGGRRFDDTPMHKVEFQIFFTFEKMKEGLIEEQFDFNRMILMYEFRKKQAIFMNILE